MCFAFVYVCIYCIYVMFAIFNCCDQKLLYADFANKIYHINIISLIRNGEWALIFLNVWSFRVEICK